jgi:hypothetical protein
MYKPKASRRYQRLQVAEDYHSHFKSGEKDKNAIEVYRMTPIQPKPAD